MNGTLGWARQGWRVVRDSEGTEIAEAAVVLPLVFLFIFAILWFGLAFNTYGTITAAAREGARYAARPACSTCPAGPYTWNGTLLPNDNLVDANVVSILETARLDPTKASPNTLLPEFHAPCLNPATPGYAMSSTAHLTIYRFVQINTGNGVAGNPQQCGMIITFQYQFGSGLPFLQTIVATAVGSSQVQN